MRLSAQTPEEKKRGPRQGKRQHACGEDLRALYGGHMPGAVSIHYMENWKDPDARAKLARKETTSIEGLDIKPREQLQAMYGKLDPAKETVVYCQSGVRAAETATIRQQGCSSCLAAAALLS